MSNHLASIIGCSMVGLFSLWPIGVTCCDVVSGKIQIAMKLKRNDPCHCASGNKYKKCCLPKEWEADKRACDYWKAKLRRAMMDRIADQQMSKMPAPSPPTQQES